MILISGSKISHYTGKPLRVLLAIAVCPQTQYYYAQRFHVWVKKTSSVSQVLLLGLGLIAQCVLLVKTHEVLYMWSVHFPDIRYVSFFKDFIYFKREGKGRRKRGREISIRGCLLHSLGWRPGLQPSHVSSLGMEFAILLFTVWCSIFCSTPTRA